MIRRLARALLAAALLAATPTRADVVTGPRQGYSEAEEFGEEVEFWTDYRTPNGVAYRPDMGPSYGPIGYGVEWIPEGLPVSAQLGTDRKGWWLLMASLIVDREGRNACWKFEEIGNGRARTARALRRLLVSRVKAWAETCSALRTFGVQPIIARLDRAGPHLAKAFGRLSARDPRRLPQVERAFGIPSLMAARTSRPLLDAIADACAVARERLRLDEDGTLSFEPVKGGAEAQWKSDSCVIEQIRYLPGFEERT